MGLKVLALTRKIAPCPEWPAIGGAEALTATSSVKFREVHY